MEQAKNSSLSVQKVALHTPTLKEVAKVLEEGLKANYVEVQVEVVDCPDLRQQPFTLAAQGLGGSPRILDVGGVPNLMPHVKKEKIYNMDMMAHLAELPGAFLVGAGAGPYHTVGVNCEMMANIKTCSSSGDGDSRNGTYISLVDKQKNGACKLCKLQDSERDFALMGNFLASEGKAGKVIEVIAKRRKGEEKSFVDAMRFALKSRYGGGTGSAAVGLGGTFALLKGKAHMHVMPEFPSGPLMDTKAVNEWLRFYDMSSPLVCLGVFFSHDPGYDLREEHFHGFGASNGEGGHYHWDATPDDVHYVGYFNVAELLYRIDRPVK